MGDNERVAVVTGGNRGTGLQTCRLLAERGYRVWLAARSRSAAEEAAESLGAPEGRVIGRALDVTAPSTIEALRDELVAGHGRVDVLVNGASALHDPGPDASAVGLLDAGPDTLRRSFETNCLGTLAVCRAFVPVMRAAGYGRIVNVSTGLAALRDMSSGWPAYRLSKVALNAATRILAAELKDTNVKANAVDPGWAFGPAANGDPAVDEEMRAIEEAADTIIWLATLRDDGPSGGFFRDCKSVAW